LWILAVAMMAVLAGCGDSGNRRDASSHDRGGASAISITSTPNGSERDPLDGLPVAQSASSLLVPSYDQDATSQRNGRLLLINLASQQIVGLDEYAEIGDVAFTAGGDAVWVAGDRLVGVRNAASGQRTMIPLPHEVNGTISSMQTIDDVIAVTVGRRSDRDRQTVLLTESGTLHCAGPKGTTFTVLRSRWLWSEDTRTRLDPARCEVTDGLKIPVGTQLADIVIDDANAFVTAFDQPDSQRTNRALDHDRVYRFDVTSGEQRSASPSLPADPVSMIVHGHELWVTSDSKVTRLDAATLRLIDSVDLPHDVATCGGDPTLVGHVRSVYLLDDCSGVLYLLDGTTGRPERGWTVPNDGSSDIQINTVSTDDGIWMVDEEQTAVPYLFDVAQQRFERLPIDASTSRTLVAIPWAVYPGPKPDQDE
jgi:hypothetical protein